ncbi:MAG: PAS domain S-box protein [Planctomycetes bacterium]|nr:PAS domain S-box protein [Planctomycetota bacterium]MCB9886403.1 PAS domain S-box protein [Planctomycetota bacterium]
MLPLERILEEVEVGIVVHDETTRIIYGNRKAQQVLGVAESEMRRRTTFDPRWALIHTDGRPFEGEEIPVSRAIRTGAAVYGVVVGALGAGGARAWLKVDANPIRDAGGRVTRVIVSFTDITTETTERLNLQRTRESLGEAVRRSGEQLTRARLALQLSEAEYHSVLRAMAEGVAVHAADGRILFANPAAERILGLSLAQMQGRHPVDPAWRLTDERGEPLPAESIPSEITRRTGVAQRNVVLGVNRDSKTRSWLSVSTDPIEAPGIHGGDWPTVVATFTDVTAERDALEAARRSRDHLSDLAGALPGVMLEYLVRSDGRDRFLYISEPARDYFDIEPARGLEDPAYMWGRLHPEDTEKLSELIRESIRTGRGIQAEFRLRAADGSYRHARLSSGAPKTVPEGVLFRSVMFDATAQKRLEETVREAQRRDAMGTLAAGIAHNFNNLLATIIPNLELARSRAPEALHEELDDAQHASTAAAELVRQLMQLVRRDIERLPEVVDAGELLTEVGRMCSHTFGRAITIDCRVGAERCLVKGRRAELQQVVLNLCLNARDALLGRPEPRLALAVRAAEGSVWIEVEDNGVGMTEEVQERLGQPFFTTKAPGLGTGLGLATVYGILRDLGGSLECTSQLQVGTRFVVRLPRAADELAPVAPTSARAQDEAMGLRLLVVDDEPLVRSVLQRMLRQLGCEVVLAEDGNQALRELAADGRIDGVLLDLAMPGLSGQEVLQRMTAAGSSTPVFVLSGFVPEGIDLAGAVEVLNKPLQLADLTRVCAVLRQTRQDGPQK